MAGYLLDTNHLSAAVAPVSRVRDRIYQVHRTGIKLGTCVPALCELEVSLQQRKNPGPFRRTLQTLLSKVRLWPLDRDVVSFYGEIYLAMKRKGRALSQVDMMLASIAKLMKMTLLTSDHDFQALPEIPTENWLS
jgi:predicted nucleic acid-binding protein